MPEHDGGSYHDQRLRRLEDDIDKLRDEAAARSEKLSESLARIDEKLKNWDRVVALGYVMLGVVGSAVLLALLRLIAPSLAATITEHLTGG